MEFSHLLYGSFSTLQLGASGFSGMEWWTGMLEWNVGMEWWTGMMEWQAGTSNKLGSNIVVIGILVAFTHSKRILALNFLS